MMLYNSGRSFGDFIPTQTHPKNRNVLPCKKSKTKPDGNPKPIEAELPQESKLLPILK